MKLDHYICDLLYQHDCVIVSDFGGFVTNFKNATIHPVQHTFFPPSKQVAFNEGLKNNDGLLANYISNRLSVSYPDACRLISEFVNNCNQKLSSNNKLVIENIGELYYDFEKNLQFIPDEKVNYHLESFGLFEIQSPAIKREKGYELFEGDAKLAAKIIPAAKRRKIIKPLLRTISVIGVAALISVAYFNPTINGSISKGLAGLNVFENAQTQTQHTISPQDIVEPSKENFVSDNSAAVEENQAAEVIAETVAKKNISKETVQPLEEKVEVKPVPVETSAKVALPNLETPKAEPIAKETSEKQTLKSSIIQPKGGNYFIIGGCFGVHENAIAFAEELKAKGFPSQLLGKGKRGLEMVCISSAANRNKAEEMLGFIHDSGYPDAWIIKK